VRQLVALESGQPRRPLLHFHPLFVEASERGLLESDLALEHEASAAAVPPAELLELALGRGESLGCSVALPFELLLAPGESPRVMSYRGVVWSSASGSAAERSSARAARSCGPAEPGSRRGVSRSIASRSAR